MKRIFLLTIAMMTAIFTCDAAMTKSRIRKEARFLTDKMAYELNLSTAQYNDVYEINYDFIDEVNLIMDEVLDGYAWAMDDYYYLLDLRNDDLRWVLNAHQYYRMMDIDYFYRPIYLASSNWSFRVHLHYTNFNHFYFDKPHHYSKYKGGHGRHHWDEISFYKDRHQGMSHHIAPAPIRHNEVTYRDSRKSDFGAVKERPNTEKRSNITTRRSNNDDTYNIPIKKESRTGTVRRATSTNNNNNNKVEKSTRTPNREKRGETTTTKKENNSNRSSGTSVRSSSSRNNSNSSTSTRSSSSSSRSSSSNSRSNSGSSRGSR